MDAHVLNVVQIIGVAKVIVVAGEHLAHVLGSLNFEGVRFTTVTEVTALLAPVDRGGVPLEGFLAGGVAHTTFIVRVIGQSRHFYIKLFKIIN